MNTDQIPEPTVRGYNAAFWRGTEDGLVGVRRNRYPHHTKEYYDYDIGYATTMHWAGPAALQTPERGTTE